MRALHGYLGVLIAPTVLFFATTGILQVYNLHEARPGYTPPPAIEAAGRLHKDQVLAERHHGPDHDAAAAKPQRRAAHEHAPPPTPLAVLALKAFVTAVALGLIASTLLGLWMALQPSPRRRTHIALLIVGIAIPLVLALLTG